MAVNRKTGEGTVEEFMGRKLDTPIPYDYEYDTYETKPDAIGANKWPSDADEFVLASVNKRSETSAKSAAYNNAIKELREKYENSTEGRRKAFIAQALASKVFKTEDEAGQFFDARNSA